MRHDAVSHIVIYAARRNNQTSLYGSRDDVLRYYAFSLKFHVSNEIDVFRCRFLYFYNL